MKLKKLTLVLTAFLALVALPFAAEAQPGRAPGDVLRNPRALARYLRLTPAQIETAKGLQQELKAAVEPLRETQKSLREALRAELGAASPNACEVGEAALALHDNREKIRAEIEEFDDKLSAILTPAQLARYEALKETARQLRGGEDD
ncbi:MAG TPA: periplasmic heavy metal sensor [Thermoanaerobaculia bacterium]|nr:periplasmic heavy metal sensor [Thermoanaerobaculia bacterium]